MHDGIQLELQGVPTGVIITEPFVGAARAMASLDGLPAYRFVTLPHPTAELDPDGVRRSAARVAGELAAILLGTPPRGSIAPDGRPTTG